MVVISETPRPLTFLLEIRNYSIDIGNSNIVFRHCILKESKQDKETKQDKESKQDQRI
jgi:hypothetical protein